MAYAGGLGFKEHRLQIIQQQLNLTKILNTHKRTAAFANSGEKITT